MSLFKRHKHQWSPWQRVTVNIHEFSGQSVRHTEQIRQCQDPTCQLQQTKDM